MTPHPLLPLAHKMLGHAAGLLLIGGGWVVSSIDFRDQITLGTIIVSGVIVAVAGLFTIRSRIASVWREDAEGQRAAKEGVQVELAEALASRAEFEKEQAEVRAELRATISDLASQIKVLEARTDLTAALNSIREMNEATVTAVSTVIADALRDAALSSRGRDEQTHALLTEIRDKLPTAV